MGQAIMDDRTAPGVNDRVFVLGVGTQKAGTTWLHSYVRNNDFANMGFTKEYHIWDAVHSEHCREFKVTKRGLVRAALKLELNGSLLRRYLMQTVDGYYERYFENVFAAGYRMTGDITPSYCVLDAQQFQDLRKKISSTGAQVKVVFLMRDPFERCWSTIRMFKRKEGADWSDERMVEEHFASVHVESRTRYEVICENLLAAFDESELHFGFYENMFEAAKVADLSRFLGVPNRPDAAGEQFNVSRKIEGVSEDLRRKVRDYYAETYEYCFRRFPECEPLWS